MEVAVVVVVVGGVVVGGVVVVVWPSATFSGGCDVSVE